MKKNIQLLPIQKCISESKWIQIPVLNVLICSSFYLELHVKNLNVHLDHLGKAAAHLGRKGEGQALL